MLEFRQFTAEDIAATTEKWEQEADDYDCFPDEVERKLQPIRTSLSGVESGSHKTLYYGVFRSDSHVAIGLAEMILSDRGELGGKWLKLLQLTMSPEIDSLCFQEQSEAIETTVKAYIAAVLGAFDERMVHEADTLKIYGRNDDQLKFLMVLMTTFNEAPDRKLSVKKNGRWLVLSTAN